MVSRNKIVTTAIILLLLSVLLSGCIEEKNITTAPESIQEESAYGSSQNLTRPSGEEIIPEIKITSFSSIYMHDNSEQKDIYLFSWENVPGNESDRLRSFFKDNFLSYWVDNAQITKDKDNKNIHVFTDENSIEIILYNKTAQINFGEGGSSNLYLKEENGTHKLYDTSQKYQNTYDISPRYYAAYSLSIKNNGSGPLYFKLEELRLHEGDHSFNVMALEPYNKNSSLLEVLQDLANENKLQDTVLLPGQSLNGIVAFRVNSLYNESFLLKYDATPVTSESFEKSIKALRTAEHFNYLEALGIFPYTKQILGIGNHDPEFNDEYFTWANWLNRNIFEAFQKSDVERMRKYPPDSIPETKMVYALKVKPEKNITIFPVTTRSTNHLLVMNDARNEIINTSEVQHIGYLSNQTYIRPGWIGNIPQMNFSNAYIVQISFEGTYGWPLNSRMSFNNQDVILDDGLNITVVRSESSHFLS